MTADRMAGLGSKLGEGIGEPLHWLGELAILKATGAETDGRFALAEVYVTQEGAPPPHIHHNEDEAFYVIEGEITVQVGDRTLKGTPGSFLWLPRDVPHSYQVDSAPYARVLFFFFPAGFEGFIRATSVPAPSLTPPPASEAIVDFEQIMALADQYGAEFVTG